MSIQVLFEDIFNQDVDCIVNPANSHMLHGGGLAAAIVYRAGDSVRQASQAQSPIDVGDAIHTEAGSLPFEGIIHAVGPRYVESSEEFAPWYAEGDPARQDEQLADAYKNSIAVAANAGYSSIAFPAISCGVFRFPVKQAAPIAIKALREAQEEYPDVTDIRICVLDDDHYDAFCDALEK